MSAASNAILTALWEVLRAWLATPEGQKVLSEVEGMALQALPGWEGAALRLLAAAVPHDVASAGLRKDGPG